MRYLRKNPDLCLPVQIPAEGEQSGKIFFPDEGQREAFETVTDFVLAPALDSFVLWVLREALISGKKRLYFLARDGYLMYRAASCYCERFGLPIQCRYLCCSRYSVRIPAFHLDMDEAMDYICRGGIDVTMHKILCRAGLSPEEERQILRLLASDGREREIIPYAKLARVRHRLEQCEPFCDLVRLHSEQAMPALAGYLRQEGFLEDVPAALVDSGWVGSMQKLLNEILRYLRTEDASSFAGADVGQRLEGYYWGLYELPGGVPAEDYHCYYFSPSNGLKEKIYFSNCLFEGVFSAPHGMTLGYEEKKGSFRPVFAEITPDRRAFMEAEANRILYYTGKRADRIREAAVQREPGADMEAYLSHIDQEKNRRTVYRLFKLFMAEPTRQEAEVFGRLQFSDDVLEESGQPIAAQLSQRELRDNYPVSKALRLLGIRKGHVKESAWYEGSAVRGGRHAGRHLRRYAGYKYLLYQRKNRMRSRREDG